MQLTLRDRLDETLKKCSKEIDKYDEDGKCKKAYQKAAAKVLRKSNADFDQILADVLKGVK